MGKNAKQFGGIPRDRRTQEDLDQIKFFVTEDMLDFSFYFLVMSLQCSVKVLNGLGYFGSSNTLLTVRDIFIFSHSFAQCIKYIVATHECKLSGAANII